jgi:signal transduction histidine kinase
MMLTRFARWYRDWELETMAVLRDPAQAEKIAPGYRRWMARSLARLSEVERRQLHDFCVRWPGPRFLMAVLAIVGVLVMIGIGVHLLNPDKPLALAIVAVGTVGLCAASAAFGMWFNYRLVMRRKARAIAWVVVAAAAGAVTGLAARAIHEGRPVPQVLAEHGAETARLVAAGIAVLVLVVLLVVALRNASYEKLAVQLRAEAEQERLARQLTESQLRLLHAQIEPHFLFNTLGAVQQLAERDHAGEAARLTANLIAFLRATAGGMAREMASLRDEFELARAYLGVMKARLGERLEVAIDLPAELAHHRLPGMALLTLAENAIKHGVEPARGPVRVHLAAVRDGDHVKVRVQDSGVGLSDAPAGGMGLRNLRDRLRLAFGQDAALSLHEQESGGVAAEIALPLDEKKPARVVQ